MASQYSCGCTAIAKRGQGGQRQILTPCKGVEEERTKDRSKRSMRIDNRSKRLVITFSIETASDYLPDRDLYRPLGVVLPVAC